MSVFAISVFLSFATWTPFVVESIHVETGTHCSNVTELSGIVERCAQCFFPQNCLENNICLLGSTGALCEKCQHFSSPGNSENGYYRVGNICTPCLTFPWAIIGFSIFMFLALFNSAYNGLTASTATKIKQLVDFLQYIVLTASIKVPWSKVIVKAAVVFHFSFFSSSLATPACMLSDSLELYYMEWGVCVGLVIVLLVTAYILDKQALRRLRKSQQEENQRIIWKRRSVFRRLAFLTLMIFYVPVTVCAIQSFSCTGAIFPETLYLQPNKELFLYDLTIDCDNIGFAAMNSFYTLILIFYPCLLPLAMFFFILRQKKWNLLQSKMINYGCFYEMYKDRWAWWESLVMIRKLIYIILAFTYPLTSSIQALVHISVTGFFLITGILVRPYRKFTWKNEKLKRISPTVMFDGLSNFCLIILDIDAMLAAHNLPTAGIDWTFFAFLLVTLFFWLGTFLAVQEERPQPELTEFEIPILEKTSDISKDMSSLSNEESVKPTTSTSS